jgi:hypothetical protein
MSEHRLTTDPILLSPDRSALQVNGLLVGQNKRWKLS